MTVEIQEDDLRQLCQDINFLKSELDRWQERLIDRFAASMAEFDGIMQGCDNVLYRATQMYEHSPGVGEGQDIKIPPDQV